MTAHTPRYGHWPTPISASLVAAHSAAYDELHIDRGSGSAYWVEGRSSGDVLVRAGRHSRPADVVGTDLGVGSAAFGYGGGSYTTADDTLWFVSQSDQSLWRQSPDGRRVRVVEGETAVSYGDLRVTADRRTILCVREHGRMSESSSDLVAVAADGGKPVRLAVTGDFHAAPDLSPDERTLAWTSWEDPSLPWDATTLWVADWDRTRLSDLRRIAGGDGESVLQPRWSPNGALYFVSDRSGWWNLYRWSGDQVERVAVADAEMAAAPWELGYSSYVFLDDGRIAILLQQGGSTQLALHDPGSGSLTRHDLPYTSMKPYLATDGRRLGLIASSPLHSPAVVTYDLTTGRLETLADGTPPGDPGFIAQPRLVDFPTTDAATAHAVFYPPTNATVHPGSDPPPPLIIRPHAGPTSAAPVRLDLAAQFFTSRGFAVADVDYRGSTGYGRPYRRQLNGRWGQLDVSDCVDAARYLISLGEVDPRNVMIAGASAGGYTALMAAVGTTFAAATARSAIVDPRRWQENTTSLQRHHADALVGPDGLTTYLAKGLRVPVLLIHGGNDSVASLDDILQLEQELRLRHRPCALLVLPGEGHTIRGRGHIEQALEAELYHYLAVLDATDAADEAR